jgi:hypothetical protein
LAHRQYGQAPAFAGLKHVIHFADALHHLWRNFDRASAFADSKHVFISPTRSITFGTISKLASAENRVS